MQTEPQMWMVVGLKNFYKLILMYLFGDQRQLGPPKFSATATPAINEWSAQIGLSFFRRAVDSGFRCEQPTESFHAH